MRERERDERERCARDGKRETSKRHDREMSEMREIRDMICVCI